MRDLVYVRDKHDNFICTYTRLVKFKMLPRKLCDHACAALQFLAGSYTIMRSKYTYGIGRSKKTSMYILVSRCSRRDKRQ